MSPCPSCEWEMSRNPSPGLGFHISILTSADEFSYRIARSAYIGNKLRILQVHTDTHCINIDI